jgi:hypothetical protein
LKSAEEASRIHSTLEGSRGENRAGGVETTNNAIYEGWFNFQKRAIKRQHKTQQGDKQKFTSGRGAKEGTRATRKYAKNWDRGET